MEVYSMKITKVASKCAAVLCAMTVMLPAAAVAVPANTAFSSNAIVASAAENDYGWLTGDQYVAIGDQIKFEVNLGAYYRGNYSNSDFKYQWYYSDTQSGTLQWNKISGATGTVFTDTMTAAKNMRHYKVEITNTKTNEVHDTDWFSMRTVNCNAVTAKFGTASVQSNGYVKVPVSLSGLYNNLLSGASFELNYDSNVFEAVKFYSNTNLSVLDNNVSAGVYRVSAASVSPVTVSGGDFGYFMLKPKSGKSANGSKLTLTDLDLMASGGNLTGVVQYGTTNSSTTISTGSSTTSLYPVVQTQVKDRKIGFKWNAVPGAEKYGVGVYQANKWVVKKQVDGSVHTWTSPQVGTGTYRLVVLAKVNGSWVSADVFKHAFYVTVK
jgi:hypothetical protein